MKRKFQDELEIENEDVKEILKDNQNLLDNNLNDSDKDDNEDDDELNDELSDDDDENEKNTDVSKIIIYQYILEMILHGQ